MIAGNAALIPARSPRSARRPWLKIIIGLLVGHTALMMAFVVIATRDASFSVNPDYYGKAVRWDQDQARRRASDQLGWTAALEVGGPVGSEGRRAVALNLADATGRPIPVGVADVVYFHHARGREKRTAMLAASNDPMKYEANLLLPQAGEWEFQINVRSGSHEFLKTMTIDVP